MSKTAANKPEKDTDFYQTILVRDFNHWLFHIGKNSTKKQGS